MTDPVCTHGKTALEKWASENWDVAIREQGPVGEAVYDLALALLRDQRQLANCDTPQEPPGESQDNCDTIATSGSEPFDLRRKLNEAMQIPTNPKMYEGPFGLDPTDVRVHNVLSVLRSTAFREWANSLDHKADTQWCNSCYNQDRRNSLGCTQDLLTELFGEVES